MQKLKILVFTFLVILLLSSCSEYYKVLNKGLNADRYKFAVELYDKGEFKKAIPLFEKLVGPYSGKPQMERIQYMIADSYYQTEDYSLSSYYFSKFIVNFSESSKVQEAAYLSAKSYFLATPKYSRDQEDTYKALTAFQSFIDKYPNSELVPEANKYYKELNYKLEKKSFEVAKQYYHTENYNAAIVAFDTFNEEFLGSVFKEEALFIRFKSAYQLGMKSILSKKEERLLNAKLAYAKLIRSFPETKNLEEANRMLKQLDEELIKVKEQLTAITQNK
jgi:outer membrane protein assembly factor BamD